MSLPRPVAGGTGPAHAPDHPVPSRPTEATCIDARSSQGVPLITTILTPTDTLEVTATAEGNDLWISGADLTRTTGYVLKPEGFCLADVCVPVPAGRASEFVRDGSEGISVNVANFWRYLDAAVVADDDGATWSLGEPPTDRSMRLDSLRAPDFTLPDASGTPHSLSDYRGRKVLLAAWASW